MARKGCGGSNPPSPTIIGHSRGSPHPRRERREVKEKLETIARSMGIALFGVADLNGLPDETFAHLPRRYSKAVALAVALSSAVLEDVEDRPTPLYLHHYRQVNYLLDRAALALATAIEAAGFPALPVPASQYINRRPYLGHISHRELGHLAGLGWRGRNNLLVTPEYGSRVRLVTILTDLPLPPDRPLVRDCGDCRKCVELCPAGAIAKEPSEFDHIKCYEQLGQFKKGLNLGHYICGVCVKACSPDNSRETWTGLTPIHRG